MKKLLTALLLMFVMLAGTVFADAPVLSISPITYTVLEGDTVTIPLTGTAIDGDGNPVTYNVAAPISLPSASCNPANVYCIVFTTTPPPMATFIWDTLPGQGRTAPYVVRFEAADQTTSERSNYVDVSITVQANSAPVINTTAPTTATAGIAYSYNADATDTNSDTLTFSLVGTSPTNYPAGMTINSATGVVSWTPTTSQVGTQTFTVKVIDTRGGDDTEPVTVTVAANQAPVVTSTPVTTVLVGQAYSYTVTATDPEGQALTFAVAPTFTLLTGMSFSTSTHVFTWTPLANQSASDPTLVFTITDAFGIPINHEFTLTVQTALENQNAQYINLTNEYIDLENQYDDLENDVEDACDDYENAIDDNDNNDADDALDDLDDLQSDLEDLQDDDLDDLEDDFDDLSNVVDNDNSDDADDLVDEIEDFIDEDIAELREDIDGQLELIDNECQASEPAAPSAPVVETPVVVVQQPPIVVQQPVQTQSGQVTTPAAQQPAEQVSFVTSGTTQQPTVFPTAQRVQVFDTKKSGDFTSVAVMAGIGVLLLLLLVVMFAVLLRR